MRNAVLVTSLILITVCALLACGEDPPPEGPSKKIQSQSSQGCGKSGAPKGFLEKKAVSIRNNARTYDLFVPDAHDGKTTTFPLVFVFHGSGGDAAGIRKAYDLEGAAAGQGGAAIFVYPNAQNGEWDLERKADNNLDILFFNQVLEDLTASHCIDVQRVFATGYSNGGYFASQLACRRGAVLRAIASHAGGGPFGTNDEYDNNGQLRCPEKPVAALISHGTADNEVKLEEAQKSRDHWRRVNGCKTGGGVPYDPYAPCVSLAACASERPVVYCEVPGLGHEVWPANGAKATWSFFSSF